MMKPPSHPAMNMLFVVKYFILAFLFGDLAIAAITSSKTENLKISTISTRDTGRGSANPHGHFYASVAPPARASDLPDLQLSSVPNYSRFWARSIPTIHPARAQHKAHLNTSPSRKRNTTRVLYNNAQSAQPKESSYSCKGSRQCNYLDPIRGFCNAASAYIKPDNYYGTSSKDSDTGTCHSYEKTAWQGCGVFVEGENCQLIGSAMKTAYDNLHDPKKGNCDRCGSVEFSNGCYLKVDYVTGCKVHGGPYYSNTPP